VGGLGDRSFNDSAYAGLQCARARLHVAHRCCNRIPRPTIAVNLTVLANKEYDEIFAIGFLMAKDVDDVAARYPNGTSRSSTRSSTSPTSPR
jgi:basic membrane protein A